MWFDKLTTNGFRVSRSSHMVIECAWRTFDAQRACAIDPAADYAMPLSPS